MLSQIIKMVETAQGSHAPSSGYRSISRFCPHRLIRCCSSYWTVLQSSLTISFVGILVIACPCALGLATPPPLSWA